MKLYATLLTLLYFLSVAQALPTDIDARAAPAPAKPKTNPVDNTKAPKEVSCDPVSKYTVNWFLANKCVTPKPSTCLFYTYGLSLKARAYAKAHKPEMTTIWVSVPPRVQPASSPHAMHAAPPPLAKYFFS